MALRRPEQAADSAGSPAPGPSAVRRSIAQGASAKFSRHRVTQGDGDSDSKSSRYLLSLSLPRSGDVVPEANDRFFPVLVLEAEHADAGGAAVEEPPRGRRQAE